MLSIKSNILLSSILVFLVNNVSLRNGYIRKWETQKIRYKKKMKEKKFFKEWDLPQNDIIWSKMRMRLDEVKKMLLRFHATRKEHNTIHILKANFVSQIHTKYRFIRFCSLTHFYKQFRILDEFFVQLFLPFHVWYNEIFDENFMTRVSTPLFLLNIRIIFFSSREKSMKYFLHKRMIQKFITYVIFGINKKHQNFVPFFLYS